MTVAPLHSETHSFLWFPAAPSKAQRKYDWQEELTGAAHSHDQFKKKKIVESQGAGTQRLWAAAKKNGAEQAERSGQRNTTLQPFAQSNSQRSTYRFLYERAIMSRYDDTSCWFTIFCPLQSAKVHFKSPHAHHLHILSLPVSVHSQSEDPLTKAFLFNQWLKTPQSTFKKQPIGTKRSKGS